MFIGHYGASLVAKKVAPKISLGWYFAGAQFLDVLFSIFVLTGIEKLRIVPGINQVNAYDLYYMPYTHSLVGALVWSLLATALVFVMLRGAREALTFGAVVFSHFIFDVPVHTHDLPLAGNESLKLGFGLWSSWPATVGLELLFLAIGLSAYWSYRKADLAKLPRQRTPLIAFSLVLVLLTMATPFLPPPADGNAFAFQALFGYFALALVAWRVDRTFSNRHLSKTAPAS